MYIDAHNHLDFYGEKLNKAIEEINEHKIITIGCAMDEKSYLFTKEIAGDNPRIIPCFGVHPWKAYENWPNLDKYEEYIKETPMIGEIGLDFHWVTEKEKYPAMAETFEYFVQKAKKYDKLTNIHTKGAEQEILAKIKQYNLITPIIHWYSGPIEVLKKLMDYGCYFTVSVDVGYSKLTEEIIGRLPLNRILTETDGPTALEWVNGKFGCPTEVKNIVKSIAEIKKLAVEEVRHEICCNFKKILKKGGMELNECC